MSLAEALVGSRPAGEVSRRPSGSVEERFHYMPHVVSARSGDATVLMDQKRGRYFTLNEVGGRVWELVGASATVSGIVERLLEEYDVGREQLETDIAATLQQLIGDRLLAWGVASGPRPPERARKPTPRSAMKAGGVTVPSVLRCGLLIAWIKALLRIRGFLRTHEWIRHRIESIPATADAEAETVQAVEHAVAMAGALYPGRAKCLEQSLALYYYLRRCGVRVALRMGAQPHPFLGHAWVEYRHLPINDFPEHIKQFVVFPELDR